MSKIIQTLLKGFWVPVEGPLKSFAVGFKIKLLGPGFV